MGLRWERGGEEGITGRVRESKGVSKGEIEGMERGRESERREEGREDGGREKRGREGEREGRREGGKERGRKEYGYTKNWVELGRIAGRDVKPKEQREGESQRVRKGVPEEVDGQEGVEEDNSKPQNVARPDP